MWGRASRTVISFGMEAGKIIDIKLYNSDCLVGMTRLETGSVDLVLTDLPYGATAVACLRTGRRFVGFETDQGYFQIAQQRVEEEKARL